ncbi:MAG: P-loop NTPase, partial [Bacteroidota bacterium]
GIVENMSWFTPLELPDARYHIFGQDGGRQLAEKYGVPLLGQIPLVQGIRESGDSGLPAVMKEGISSAAFGQLRNRLPSRSRFAMPIRTGPPLSASLPVELPWNTTP